MATYSAAIEFTHRGGNRPLNATIVNSAKAEVNVEEAITDGADDLVIDHPSIKISKVKQVYIQSSQAVTLKNENVGADDEIPLRANEPYIWHENDYNDLLFTEDISEGNLQVTNASGATAELHLRWIVDTTAD